MKKGSVSFYVLKQRARRELEETAAGRLLTCVGNNLQTDQSWARLYVHTIYSVYTTINHLMTKH